MLTRPDCSITCKCDATVFCFDFTAQKLRRRLRSATCECDLEKITFADICWSRHLPVATFAGKRHLHMVNVKTVVYGNCHLPVDMFDVHLPVGLISLTREGYILGQETLIRPNLAQCYNNP